MAGVLMTQAALAAAEKRVDECIRCICEAQVGYMGCLELLHTVIYMC